MRSAATRRPAFPYMTVGLTVLITLLGAAGAVGSVFRLWKDGRIELPFLTRAATAEDTRGLVAVPLCSRPIPAYTRVTRDFLLDPKTGLPKRLYLRPEEAQQLGVITDFNQVLGRVVSHEKPADYTFKEEDFLPKGTRPGLVAGIPAGKRAVVFDASKIQGIHALKAGDRLDIVATRPIDLQKVFSQARGAGGAAGVSVGILAQQKTAAVRVLVQNGVLVAPVATRVVPISSSSLTQGAVTRTKPVQEAIIAVDPEEIAPLSEAMSVGAEMVCVARSGLPEDPGPASVTPPGADLTEQVAAVETIVGGQREVHYFPKVSASPRPAPAGAVAGAGVPPAPARVPVFVRPRIQ